MINEGIYKNLDIEEYHGDKNSISRSAIMDFKKSPFHYYAKHIYEGRPEKEKKASWEFGTAFHALILEPEIFYNKYACELEKMPLLKDVGRECYEQAKEKRESWKKENENKTILSIDEWDRLDAMRVSLFENKQAKRLLENGLFESSYFWKDEESGLLVKSRPDVLNYNIYIDLKTTSDASPSNYQKEMAKHGYYIQAAMIKDALKVLKGEKLEASINICVEKSYPYSVAIYFIDEAAIETGRIEYKSILQDMKACIISNKYTDYPILTIGLPAWHA